MDSHVTLDLSLSKERYSEEEVLAFIGSEESHAYCEGVYRSRFEIRNYSFDVTYLFYDDQLLAQISQLEKRVSKAFPEAKMNYHDGILLVY